MVKKVNLCDKDWFNVFQVTNGGNFTGDCSKDEAHGCDDDKIDDCQQTICYSKYDSSLSQTFVSKLCHLCKPKYIPAGNDIWGLAGANHYKISCKLLWLLLSDCNNYFYVIIRL